MSQNDKTTGYFLNDFHKKRYERCMAGIEQTRSMPFSHEFLKAQSVRLTEQMKQEEEEERCHKITRQLDTF